MFLRSHKRKKNGIRHQYFSIVENRRCAGGTTVQRTVLYLGEITSSQQDTWCKTLEVFDEDADTIQQKPLFADAADPPESDIDSIKVKLSQMQLYRPRSFGDCRLACEPPGGSDLTSFGRSVLMIHVQIFRGQKCTVINYTISAVVETNLSGTIRNADFDA